MVMTTWGARSWRWCVLLALLSVLVESPRVVQAQGPQFDVGAPPGAAGGRSTLGQPLGAADFPDFETPSSAPVSGGAGRARSHVPVASQAPPGVQVQRTPRQAQLGVPTVQPIQVPAYGELEIPPGGINPGPPNGLTLDAAIEELIQQNLDLFALRLEIPMADADVLTANLRANPIFYADTQLIPYGHFSFLRPGGPAQTDININYPLDVTRKRRARTLSARQAKRVAEAQLQDAVRLQIDNLYTTYVNVVATRLTLQYSQKYVEGLRRLLKLNQELLGRGFIKPTDVLPIQTHLERAEMQVREATQALAKSQMALAQILNRPLTEPIQVRDYFRDVRKLSVPTDVLVQKAVATRPDLMAIRLGVARAEADVRLARANRYPDVYLLYQPYTYQNNTYLGVPSATSWTLGVTATIPLYNRNQGNITRAEINVTQTQAQAASLERAVVSDSINAVREFELSLKSVEELEANIVPATRKVRDGAYLRWQGGETSVLEYLEAQKDYNEVVRDYRDALIRHRNAMLDLNTAVGERIMP
jgi:outer membrane protein, heavy metal efflux system